MPVESPGARFSVIATKATQHGDPAVELGHAGVAAKSTQAQPAVPSVANALAAQQIAIGEEFVIMLTGLHEVRSTLLPAGANTAGGLLYIRASDNALVAAATALAAGVLQAGFFRYGVIDSVNATTGRALVNLSLRGSF